MLRVENVRGYSLNLAEVLFLYLQHPGPIFVLFNVVSISRTLSWEETMKYHARFGSRSTDGLQACHEEVYMHTS
jgi:hypothetical protein